MITDALLNPLSFYTRHKNKDRRQANDVLPLFTTEDLSSGSERLTSSGRLLKWAGKGRDAWWACPERDEQALFDALTLRLYWPNWHEGATRLEKAVAQTLGPKDQREQLPAPYLAFATVAELMTAPLTEPSTPWKQCAPANWNLSLVASGTALPKPCSRAKKESLTLSSGADSRRNAWKRGTGWRRQGKSTCSTGLAPETRWPGQRAKPGFKPKPGALRRLR